jgi:hypothetical protein
MSEKELKLLIAGQCMASLLYKNTGYQMTGSVFPKNQKVKRQYEEIALKSWEAATELMALSKKEDDEENARVVADWHRRLEEKK